MVFKPTDVELAWIKKVGHWENFGVFNQSFLSKANPQTTFYEKVSFTMNLLNQNGRNLLGFWPYLTLRDKAIPGASKLYALYRSICA